MSNKVKVLYDSSLYNRILIGQMLIIDLENIFNHSDNYLLDEDEKVAQFGVNQEKSANRVINESNSFNIFDF